jgi:hypothetical protein
VVGAYVAFAVLTWITDILWFFAIRMAVFTRDTGAPARTTNKDMEMATTS